MFGEFALSERAIADHSILNFGALEASANFTQTTPAILVGDVIVTMNAPSVSLSAGLGILTST